MLFLNVGIPRQASYKVRLDKLRMRMKALRGSHEVSD